MSGVDNAPIRKSLLILFPILLCLGLSLQCRTLDHRSPKSTALLYLTIQLNAETEYGCRILEYASSYPFDLEEDIPLSPASSSLNRHPSNLDVYIRIKTSGSIAVPAEAGQSIHVLCEEQRAFFSQLHALRINLHSLESGIKTNCLSRGTAIMSSRSECNLALPSEDSPEPRLMNVSVDFGPAARSDRPIRACAYPFTAFESVFPFGPEIHLEMVPRISVDEQAQLP